MESQMRLLIGVLIEGRWRVDQGCQLKAAIDTAELCLLIVHMIRGFVDERLDNGGLIKIHTRPFRPNRFLYVFL